MEIILYIQSFASPFFDGFFQIVTMLGEESFYIAVLTLVFWCIDKRYGYKLFYAFLFSGVLNGVVKSIVRAPRPVGVEGIRSLRLETATGTSFPSGHVQNITSFWASLIKQLRRPWAYVVGSLLILLVGISRLYLGVHWPADVLGGIVFGTGSVLLAEFIFEHAARKRLAWLHLLPLVPALAAACLWRDSANLVKVIGTFSGFLVGYSVESSFIRFDEKSPFIKQVLKYGLGIAVIAALEKGLKLLFPQTAIFDFLRYLILGLWVTIGAPVAFLILRLSSPQNVK